MIPISLWNRINRFLNFLMLTAMSVVVSFAVFIFINWQYQRTQSLRTLNASLDQYAHAMLNDDLALAHIEADADHILAVLHSKNGDNSARMVLNVKSHLCQLIHKLPASATTLMQSPDFDIVAVLDRQSGSLKQNMQAADMEDSEMITSYKLAECHQIK